MVEMCSSRLPNIEAFVLALRRWGFAREHFSFSQVICGRAFVFGLGFGVWVDGRVCVCVCQLAGWE